MGTALLNFAPGLVLMLVGVSQAWREVHLRRLRREVNEKCNIILDGFEDLNRTLKEETERAIEFSVRLKAFSESDQPVWKEP